MLDPNMLNQMGKLRQKELIELGQQSARRRDEPARRERRPAMFLLLLLRTLGR